MQVGVITLFPELVRAVLGYGVVGRAAGAQVDPVVNYVRSAGFTRDVHRTVDDRPYGGGPGMVMKIELAAQRHLRAARERAPPGSPVIYLGPQGRPLEQPRAAARGASRSRARCGALRGRR